jgi:hypothetical protein
MGKQYWFDVIYEEAQDIHGTAKQIRMVDFSGRVDTFVVRNDMSIQEITLLWKSFMEVPDGMRINVQTGNNQEYFWGYVTAAETVPYTLRTTNFKAEQIGRLLDVKVPPLAQCDVT